MIFILFFPFNFIFETTKWRRRRPTLHVLNGLHALPSRELRKFHNLLQPVLFLPQLEITVIVALHCRIYLGKSNVRSWQEVLYLVWSSWGNVRQLKTRHFVWSHRTSLHHVLHTSFLILNFLLLIFLDVSGFTLSKAISVMVFLSIIRK